MDFLPIIASAIFITSYVFISLEHKFQTHKSAIALAVAGILWILVALSGLDKETISHELAEAGTEVFGILIFLLSAMTLVEILVHYRFFDLIRMKLAQLGLKDKGQFLVISVLTFFLSAVLDNLTVTIVMIQIARRFFKEKNLLITTAGIVIMANAGGAWSPIGDVTTIMIWLAQKFTALQVVTQAFIPALALACVSTWMLLRQMADTAYTARDELIIHLSRGEKMIITAAMGSFLLPLMMNSLGLQPYLGLLLGLGFVWLLIEYAQVRSKRETHLDANIEHFLQKTDIASLQFFTGILLSVSALRAMGILEQLSHLLLGEHQTFYRLLGGNLILGLLSAVVDNVPLTALALDLIKTADAGIWVLLALAAGTGGSVLLLGSVAGVIAAGMVKELTFDRYLKIASIPALVGYLVCMVVWYAQTMLVATVPPTHIATGTVISLLLAGLYIVMKLHPSRRQKQAFLKPPVRSSRKRKK